MCAGAKPHLQELPQIAGRPQPHVGCGGAVLSAHKHSEAVAFDSAKSRFVGQVVAEISGRARLAVAVLIKDGGNGCALVTARAQFEARLEFEQVQAVFFGCRLKQGARLFRDCSGTRRRHATPMHHEGVRLFFNQAAGCFTPELSAQRIELAANRMGKLLPLVSPIRMHALSAMETPDLGSGYDAQKRQNLLRRPPGDNHEAGFSLALDLSEQVANPRPRLGFVAVDTERRQRSVVVKQQERLRRSAEAAKKVIQFRLCLVRQSKFAFKPAFLRETPPH